MSALARPGRQSILAILERGGLAHRMHSRRGMYTHVGGPEKEFPHRRGEAGDDGLLASVILAVFAAFLLLVVSLLEPGQRVVEPDGQVVEAEVLRRSPSDLPPPDTRLASEIDEDPEV